MGLSLLTDFLGHFENLGITIIMSLTTIANAQKKKSLKMKVRKENVMF